MSDGVVDFAVMVRGCGLVTNWYFERKLESRIFNLRPAGDMIEMIISWLPAEPAHLNSPETVEACIAALDRLHPLLQSPAHRSFFDALRQSYKSLLVSYRAAFHHLTLIYTSWGNLTNTSFLTFIAPGNHISRALFMHYVTIDSFMHPVYMELARTRNLPFSGGNFLIYRWAEDVFLGLPEGLKGLVEDQVMVLAIELLPEVELHRRRWPQWERELEGFVGWLRRWVPADVLGSYNI
jgi:hypothetical protein